MDAFLRSVVACLAVSVAGLAAEFTLRLDPGWNLVSLPILPEDPSPAAVFGDARLGAVWEYDAGRGSYVEARSILPGRGYWIYAAAEPDREGDDPPPLVVTGTHVREVTVPLGAGWNLLGPISYEPYAALPAPIRFDSGERNEAGPVWIWRDLRYRAVDSLACGSGAWVRCAGPGSARVSPNPVFGGAVMAYSPEVGRANAHWPEASDDRTAADALRYRIYAAEKGRGELLDEANLATTVVGATTVELAGLTPGATYEIAVVAEDEAGNRNHFNRTILSLPIMETPNVLDKVPRDIVAEGFQVLGMSTEGGSLTLTVADKGSLAVGDFILFDNPNGPALREITGFVQDPAGTKIITDDGVLAWAFDTGVLRSSVAVSDLDGVAATAAPDGRLAYDDPGGVFHLTAEPGDGARAGAGEANRIEGRWTGDVDLGDGLGLEYAVGFRPAIETEVRFGGASVPYCRIAAAGEFELDARARYALASGTETSRRNRLFGLRHSFPHWIGELAVWQEVGMDVYAEMEASSEGPLDMDVDFAATAAVLVGAEFDGTTWRAITNEGFAHDTRFEIRAGGTMLATVRIYPVVWMRLYSSPAASFRLDPAVGVDSLHHAAPAPAERIRFDVDFQVDAEADASLGMLGWQLGWQPPGWRLFAEPVFSLPEIAFTRGPNTLLLHTPCEFAIRIEDGIRNPVPAGNIEWWIEPVARRDGAARGPRVGDTLVLVPGGRNWGTDPDHGDYDLSTNGFHLGKHEVTKGAWDKVRTWGLANGYDDLVAALGKDTDHPVHSVSWHDVAKWCNARSEMERLVPCYTVDGEVYRTGERDDVNCLFHNPSARRARGLREPFVEVAPDKRSATVTGGELAEYRIWVSCQGSGDGSSDLGELGRRYACRTFNVAIAGYRLPTSAEWMYAARGGRKDQRFPWGNLVTHSDANYCSTVNDEYDISETRLYHPDWDEDGEPYTSPVGSFPANDYGLHDMAGNVSEWCWDPRPGDLDRNRLIHGGDWNGWGRDLRIGCHGHADPTGRWMGFGFRVLVVPGAE